MTRYRLTKADLDKRRGDRRLQVLHALASAQAQHARNPGVEAGLTPLELSHALQVHPTSAYRCLERLRKAGAVTRTGWGVKADYAITAKGMDKIEWLEQRFGGGKRK